MNLERGLVVLLLVCCFVYGIIKGIRQQREEQGARRKPGHPAEVAAGWLYFIGPARGPINIGVTHGSPEEKLAELQVGNAAKLQIIYAREVADLQEAGGHVHNLLGEHSKNGEWYSREQAMGLMWAYRHEDAKSGT